MLVRPKVVAFFWVYYILLYSVIFAAAATQKKDGTNGDGIGVVETTMPTSAPIFVSVVINPAPAPVPVLAPIPVEEPKDSGTTEDPDEDEVNDETADMEQVCRSVSRGVAVITNTSIEILYEFELLSSTATPSYTGIAVNNAVTNHLIDRYIKPFCNQNRRARQLRWYRSLQGSFGSGDVQGITRGTTTVLETVCTVPAENIGTVACHRLQSSNTIHFRDDYVSNKDDLSILEAAEDAILVDISSAFSDGTITDEVVKGGETGLVSASYVSGTSGVVSVQGESRSINSPESSESGGMTPAGKAFLSLFILFLIFLLCYILYKKYGIPKFQKRRHERNLNVTAADTTLEEGRNPLSLFCERVQRKVPSEVRRPYHFVVAEPKYDRSERHVVISETIETSSYDGLGTEMILEDLEDHEERLILSPNDRFTPSTLPQTKEYGVEDSRRSYNVDDDGFPFSNDQSSFNDAFSFSDVNIVIDDSSSYASMGPRYMESSKRNYSVPDTVNL